MRISIIVKQAPNGVEHAKLKLYTSQREWASWGKPRSFVPSGTVRDGLTLTWSNGDGARKWSVHNGNSIQAEMAGLFLPVTGLRATITPTDLTQVNNGQSIKDFVRFAPFDITTLPFKPADAVQRRKSPKSPLVTHLHGGPRGNGQQVSLDALRNAVKTINDGLPENAVLELTDGSRRLRIMLEII